MTPKEKAEELVLKFREVPIEDSLLWHVGYEISKQFALIAVDEIIQVLDPEHWGLEMNIAIDELNYWRKVKQELNKL